MYYIYCYKNKINGHKYVGQTNNIKRRINEHKSAAFNENSGDYDLLFHKKLRQYGIDNFEIVILEEIDSNDQTVVDEREQFWIKFENSFVKNGEGYNLTEGGQFSKTVNKKISLKDAKEIQQMILKGKSYEDIQNKYNICPSYITMINQGNYFYDKDLSYPLHKYYKSDDDYNELIDLLKYSDLSLKAISEKLCLGYSTVKKINEGRLRKGLSEEYPIRKKTVYAIKADRVKDLLLNSTLTIPEIMVETKVSQETIRRINIGESHYDSNLNYPLR